MNLGNKDELKMTHLEFSQAENGLSFSVDGKEVPVRDFSKSIESIVGFVTQFSYEPVIAKIEILDPTEHFVMSLDLPIMPAFLDIFNPEEIEMLLNPQYQSTMKARARALTNGETKAAIENRTNDYINYIQHEFAGAYINCMLDGRSALANSIQKLPIMRSFDLSRFKFSGSGRVIYKTPQFLKYRTEIDGEPHIRQFYMGLQENVPESAKTPEFWTTVKTRDSAYLLLDESMNATLAKIIERSVYGIDFVGTNASSNYVEIPQKS